MFSIYGVTAGVPGGRIGNQYCFVLILYSCKTDRRKMFNVVKRLIHLSNIIGYLTLKLTLKTLLKKSTTCVQISDPLYCYVLKNHAKK